MDKKEEPASAKGKGQASSEGATTPAGPGGSAAGASIDIVEALRALPEEKQDAILARIVKGDKKGRKFGTPRNPRMPTIEEFNPEVVDVRAADLETFVKDVKHGQFPEQAERVRALSNEELLQFNLEDPMSGARAEDGGVNPLTGGHHRSAEIARRVASGELPADTVVRFLVHD